jgi:hypothetical protein
MARLGARLPNPTYVSLGSVAIVVPAAQYGAAQGFLKPIRELSPEKPEAHEGKADSDERLLEFRRMDHNHEERERGSEEEQPRA